MTLPGEFAGVIVKGTAVVVVGNKTCWTVEIFIICISILYTLVYH